MAASVRRAGGAQGSSPCTRKLGEAAEDDGRSPSRLADLGPKIDETVEEVAEADLGFGSGQGGAEAVVGAEAERQGVAVGPVQVEPIRMFEPIGVAVAGAEQPYHVPAGPGSMLLLR